NPGQSRALVMGITFKENVSDIRNSKVVELVNELKGYSMTVDVIDPFAANDELQHEYGLGLCPEPTGKYDCIVVAVNHRQYACLDEAYFQQITSNDAIFIDVKGTFYHKIQQLQYWTM
ncbi:MAG TPA: UDP binding domain-containing protein, partial [Chitinophagales bacterium]|nr:UDP binding domain-containing protein [Chitinophagales bacterium]